MKRRDFIKRTAPATILPIVLGGFQIKSYGRSPILDALAAAATATDRVFVVVQLNGGNDGLNTIIPLDQYGAYRSARSNIALPESSVLKLTNATGIHPGMADMHTMYGNGKLVVVQSVGYPNPNFSHFRATDIWLTGADSNQNLTTGWMGRYLETEFPDYPIGYPNATMPDPIAIQIGSVISTGLQGTNVSMGIAISSATNFYNLIAQKTPPAPNTPAGHELTYVRLIADQTSKYATSIKNAASKATNKATYPTSNALADQLKIVAQLIAGGLKTRIFIVNLGGFDTHNQQVNTADTTQGQHTTLLGRVSGAIGAFQTDLKLLGVEDRVVGCTFSEFGRRIISNSSAGTDHGAAAPMFVFGSQVNGGILGSNVAIPSNPTVNSNIPMQYDFRNVFASILKDWFLVPQQTLTQILSTPRLATFQYLPIIKTSSTSVADDRAPVSASLDQNYPNPFGPGASIGSSTRIRFTTDGKYVQLKIYDNAGREVHTLVDGAYPAGQHEVEFSPNGLRSGNYYVRLQSGSFAQVRTMVYVK